MLMEYLDGSAEEDMKKYDVIKVFVCCSVLQWVAVCSNVLQRVAVFCSVLQCVAVCCRARCSVSA